jgi:hypothetical protein
VDRDRVVVVELDVLADRSPPLEPLDRIAQVELSAIALEEDAAALRLWIEPAAEREPLPRWIVVALPPASTSTTRSQG